MGRLDGSTRRWRSAGRPGAATTDPLFTVPFLLAALFNIAPALLLNPIRDELIFVGGAHALFALRLSSRDRRRASSARSISRAFSS